MKKKDGDSKPPSRLVIERVSPSIDCGKTPVKRALGDILKVEAVVICDGHEQIKVRLLHRPRGRRTWTQTNLNPKGNDIYTGEFRLCELIDHEYTVEACVDIFGTWFNDFQKKLAVDQATELDKQIGMEILSSYQKSGKRSFQTLIGEKIRQFDQMSRTELSLEFLTPWYEDQLKPILDDFLDPKSLLRHTRTYRCQVDDSLAAFSAWYEFFPRSTGSAGQHGTFSTAAKCLPYIAKLGFDVVYLPPIHPIGKTLRKGKNNQLPATSDDVGSPWAIGSSLGGHKSLHPDLGTWEDFQNFLKQASTLNLKIALDIAFQCSADHPYLKEHPEWFKKRPDGSIQFAENPPKKYEDIYPFDFECEDWKNLWQELLSIFEFWIEKGVTVFRVDNPHTKPFRFWKWCIETLRNQRPDVILLSEAFTRPHVMNRLSKDGFHQSYTYFTWRHTKLELQEYMKTLTQTELSEYFRPNFWPNTPDILTPQLQKGNRATFLQRLILAATLSPNYGIYGPAFELMEQHARPGVDEYVDNEKYQLREWNLENNSSLQLVIQKLNQIRKKHSALQTLRPLTFMETENEQLIAYTKGDASIDDLIVTVVNLDEKHKQSGFLHFPEEIKLPEEESTYQIDDLLNGHSYLWQGRKNYIELDPENMPAHIFKIQI